MSENSPCLVLGITGSIAAYKSLDLIRRLDDEGIDVHVVATKNARSFFPRLPAEIFSGHPVETDLFQRRTPLTEDSGRIHHLTLLDRADAILVAPASADFIARMALGLADDLLSTILLSASVPVMIAPAMEETMYLHPASAAHRKTLFERGIREISPESGPLASGKVALGRMASTDRILSEILPILRARKPIRGSLAGIRVLISSGPTFEPLDSVRFIGNHSSGRMGQALAKAALERGAHVTVVSGPTALTPVPGITYHPVTTAQEMETRLKGLFLSHDLCIMAAAVSDYRPALPISGKRKKDGHEWTLSLVENNDILKGLTSMRTPSHYVVGFAAESSLIADQLLYKCRSKNVDLLVANDISQPETGFSSEENAVTLVTPDGSMTSIPKMKKIDVARRIFDAITAGGWPKTP